MKKIGICFGGYCPMHRGHLDVIMAVLNNVSDTVKK